MLQLHVVVGQKCSANGLISIFLLVRLRFVLRVNAIFGVIFSVDLCLVFVARDNNEDSHK